MAPAGPLPRPTSRPRPLPPQRSRASPPDARRTMDDGLKEARTWPSIAALRPGWTIGMAAARQSKGSLETPNAPPLARWPSALHDSQPMANEVQSALCRLAFFLAPLPFFAMSRAPPSDARAPPVPPAGLARMGFRHASHALVLLHAGLAASWHSLHVHRRGVYAIPAIVQLAAVASHWADALDWLLLPRHHSFGQAESFEQVRQMPKTCTSLPPSPTQSLPADASARGGRNLDGRIVVALEDNGLFLSARRKQQASKAPDSSSPMGKIPCTDIVPRPPSRRLVLIKTLPYRPNTLPLSPPPTLLFAPHPSPSLPAQSFVHVLTHALDFQPSACPVLGPRPPC
ncbi:hypothetical protein CDD83_6384 [Cordyceps sp. RAO-2017]|nr:hypothetical protein CDD83_6384 [Cordyceps sp. RAO-2017]